jgi:hypothetical protein
MPDTADTRQTDLNRLLAYVRNAKEEPEPSHHDDAPPSYEAGYNREIEIVDGTHVHIPVPDMSLEQARALINDETRAYLQDDLPAHMLLVKALPGVGKTYSAVRLAEEVARTGRRIVYFGPRHDFFVDVLRLCENHRMWYEWLPRQKSTEAHPETFTTCQYADEINVWLGKGYRGIDFCSRICGWEYVNSDCPYHAQKKRPEPIIFAQHQHATLGLSVAFDVGIGDEFPLSSFMDERVVRAKELSALSIAPEYAMSEIVAILSRLAGEGLGLHGKVLIDLLGGWQAVHDACKEIVFTPDMIEPPAIFAADEVYGVVQNVIPALASILDKEAKGVELHGDAYPHRLYLDKEELTLLMRRETWNELPAHLIWLDATADEHLYKAMFGRSVKVLDATPRLKGNVFQVANRGNGKNSLFTADGHESRRDQTEQLVKRLIEQNGYEQPAIVSFMRLFNESDFFSAMEHTHYYAARGTNALSDCDALFVLGAPLPPLERIETYAKMVYANRLDPFQKTWSTVPRLYAYKDADGNGRAYPTSGFWADADLQAMLRCYREAEIMQAAHRARPVLRNVDVWLLTNIPIDELPPDAVLTYNDIYGSPDGVNVFKFDRVSALALKLSHASPDGAVRVTDLAKAAGIHAQTAYVYAAALVNKYGWHWVTIKQANRRGRGARGIAPPEGGNSIIS